MQSIFFGTLQKRFLAMRSKRSSLSIALVGLPGIGKTHTTTALLQVLPCKNIGLHATSSPSLIASAIPKTKQLAPWMQKQLDLLHKNELPTEAIPLLLALLLEQQAPIVLHLEDAHDATTIQLEQILVLAKAILKTKGVALLLTSRVDLPEPIVALHVPRLEISAVKDLIATQLNGQIPAEALAFIETRAGGNPLFILEFLRFLTRQGYLWSDGQDWHWREPDSGFVPVTLDALIGQWLSKSVEDIQTQLVLETRAFLPESLNADLVLQVWQAVSGLPEFEFNLAKTNLIQKGLLLDTGFVHPLVREVVLRELPVTSLKNHAIRAVEELEKTDPALALELLETAQLPREQMIQILQRIYQEARGNPRVLALAQAHMVRVLPLPEQAQAALKAAKILEPFDYLEAAKLLEFAWQLKPTDPKITLALVEFRFDQKRNSEISHLLDGLAIELQEMTDVIGWRLVVLDSQGQRTQAVTAWEQHPQWHEQMSPRLLSLIARLCLREGRTDLMQQAIEFGLQRQGLSTSELCSLLNLKAIFLSVGQGKYQEALDLYSKILELDASLSSPLLNRAMIRQSNFNDLKGAKSDYEKVILVHSQKGQTILTCRAQIYLASLERQLNNLSAAEKLLQNSLLVCEKSDEKDVLFECYMELSVYYRNLETSLQDLTSFKYAKLALKLAKDSKMANYHLFRAIYNCIKASIIVNELAIAKSYLDEIHIDASKDPLSPAELKKKANFYDLLADWNEASHNIEQALEIRNKSKIIYMQLDDERNQKIQESEICRLQKDFQSLKIIQAWFKSKNHLQIVEKIQHHIDLRNANSLPSENLSSTPTFILNVLGSIQIIQNGTEIHYRAKKRLEILIYLLEARAAGQSESNHLELLDALYPELTEAEAKNALKQSVYILREKFGTDCIISTSRGYKLGAVKSDLDEIFTQPNSKLWRGTYLQGMGQSYFGIVHGALLQQLLSLAQNALSTDAAQTIRLCQILLEMEPYDQDALALLLQASTHQPHVAKSTYQTIRQRYLEIGEELPLDMKTFMTEQRVLN